MKKHADISISKLSSFQNVGQVNEVFEAENIDELCQFIKQNPSQFKVLGKGSNSIIDPNLTVPILKLGSQLTVLKREGNLLYFPASYSVANIIKVMKDESLGGLEFIAGVPASLGGMIAMNYGCWGFEISNFIQRILVIDSNGNQKELLPEECQYSYRSSCFLSGQYVVLGAWFNLLERSRQDIRSMVKDVVENRLSKQPLSAKTFGSMFKNSKEESAGHLIESIGLKGFQIGGAKVSEQHANFMINTGSASFEDAKQLMQYIQDQVYLKKQLRLEPELCVIED